MDALIIAGAVRLGHRKAEDVILGALDRAAQAKALGAFTHMQAEHAIARAQAIDVEIASGRDPGRLAGVPIAVKDNIAQAGQPLSCGSRILDGYRAPTTATALLRLEEQGAIVIGRTNMDEFGMGSSGENSAFGPTKNPVDPATVPGGSSSGSAAAVAAGIVPIALGSDTGGSVRQPASFCGVIGLKPTYGRISRSGLVAFGSSLDQIGPITRSIRDAAVVTHIMAGHDPLDSNTLTDTMGHLPEERNPSLEGTVIGLPAQCWEQEGQAGVQQTIHRSIDRLKSRGATITTVDIPALEAAIPCYYLLTSAEAASNLSRFDGIRYGPRNEADNLFDTYMDTRSKRFGREVQRRILLGTFALAKGYSEDLYARANSVRQWMRSQITETLKSVDALAMPTTPSTAFFLGDKTSSPIDMYLSDIYTTPPSLTGHPAISVPAGVLDGLPVGLQLVGRFQDEATILKLGLIAQEQ